MSTESPRTIAVLALATLLVLSLLTVSTAALAPVVHAPPVGSSAPSSPAPDVRAVEPTRPGPTGPGPLTLTTIRHDLAGRNVPVGALHLPALAAEGDHGGQPVAPTYPSAPAPMGVADIGLRDVGGSMAGYILNTSSAKGTLALTNAQSVYVDGDGPDMYGVQLNSVLTNVTLFGNSTYQFWTQNFVSYTSSSGELSFGDNVWNFSDLAGLLTPNAFFAHSSNGTVVAPVFYYAVGPTFTIHYPFTVTFYLNATVLSDRPAVFFNYTLSNTTFTKSGSFDYVIFNSSATTPTSAAPAPQFQVNGEEYDPIGLINDIELSVLGNDNGDTTTFYQMSATATIDYWNSTTGSYQPVPSAVNAGADTGETSDGVASYYTTAAPSVAQLGLGPSFLEGLWNTTTAPGVRTAVSGVTPAAALILVNPGTARNASAAQWVPASAAGTTFYLPNTGSYFVDYLLSDHTPLTHTIGPGGANGTTHLFGTLAVNTALGIYAPMIVWGNSELATFASSGAGTAANPYVLYNAESGPLYPEFAQWNDFAFPVFPGLLLIQTTDYVHVAPASYAITYPVWMLPQIQSLGLPSTNNLQDQFWNVSNVVVENATIQGWLSAFLFSFYPLGDVIFWNSTGNLIAGVTFNDQGSALALYGGTGNTVWGNTFLTGATSAIDPSAVYNGPSNQTGIWESESGDLIYNNYFSVPSPAYTPTFDPLSCQINCTSASYTDLWNVSYESPSLTRTVLGITLTGSIIGTSYQGGNYWSNYGIPSNPFGVLPYVDGPVGTLPPGNGQITNGGDYVPLVPFSLYNVTFQAIGLPSGTPWGVNTSLADLATTGPNVTLESPNGTLPFSVVYPACLPVTSAPPACLAYALTAPTNFTVDGTNVTVNLTFAPMTPVSFAETGLAGGHLWNLTLNGTGTGGVPQTFTSTGPFLNVTLTSGAYDYSLASLGYSATPSNGSFGVVSGTAAAYAVVFQLVPTLTFTESGLPTGAAWTVSLTQGSSTTNVSSTGSVLAFNVFNTVSGAYTFAVSAPGYIASPASGGGSLPANSSEAIAFTFLPGHLHLLLAPVCGMLVLNGSDAGQVCTSMNLSLAPGTYPVEITATGYLPYFNNVTVVAGGSLTLSVVLTAQPSSGGGSSSSAIGSLGWTLIAILAVLAAVFLVTTILLYSRRRPPPAKPLTPASPPTNQTAGASGGQEPPTGSAWSETPPGDAGGGSS